MQGKNFYIASNNGINSQDLENLRIFYTPIVGRKGIALYFYLFDSFNLYKYSLKKYLFEELMDFLALNETKFMKAKELLEASNLLKTYVDSNGNLIFELIKPLTANEIINNKLLSSILSKKIGVKKFNELLDLKQVATFEKQNLLDVSKKSFEVFDFESLEGEDIKNKAPVSYNFKEKTNTLEPLNFIKYINNRLASPSEILMVKKLRRLSFSDLSINLFINYSMNVNNAIVVNYINKIASDYAERNIFDAEEIDLELETTLINKINSKRERNLVFDSQMRQKECSEETKEFLLKLTNDDECEWAD
ncbi:DnaD domain protein [Metamycoplasma subdolum]|nr:DnaD domain protein [Metamycoplasma subdolum]WPB50611.1 DnaD domain protein [Metamycoplasma subdolum]